MTGFVKRFLYAINILTISYIIFAVLFSTNSIIATYKDLTEASYNIEKEYNEILDKYKRIIVFVLKNNLPINISYFNRAGDITYDLPPVKEFKSSETKDTIVNGGGNKIPNNDNISGAIECYNNKCINVFINRKEILDKISKGKLWEYNKITTTPIKKTTLLKISTNSFLEAHKNLIVVTLLYLFILVFIQSLFLFMRNLRLTKAHTSLLITSDKHKRELTKQSTEYHKICNSVLFIQELAGEYFTHYIHQLIIRDICIKEVDLIDILQRVEDFLTYQTTIRNLKIVLDYKNTSKTIKSDNEVVFIILLNLLFKAIYRAKLSSEIVIKISQVQGAINIKINDNGYEHNSKLTNKIQIYELPNPILKKLYQKLKIEVEETKKNGVNIIHAKIAIDSDIKKINIVNDNIIKLNSYGKKN